jgi:hypothetical protein
MCTTYYQPTFDLCSLWFVWSLRCCCASCWSNTQHTTHLEKEQKQKNQSQTRKHEALVLFANTQTYEQFFSTISIHHFNSHTSLSLSLSPVPTVSHSSKLTHQTTAFFFAVVSSVFKMGIWNKLTSVFKMIAASGMFCSHH